MAGLDHLQHAPPHPAQGPLRFLPDQQLQTARQRNSRTHKTRELAHPQGDILAADTRPVDLEIRMTLPVHAAVQASAGGGMGKCSTTVVPACSISSLRATDSIPMRPPYDS